MEKDSTLSVIELPLDILTEIFGHIKRRYFEFRTLCKSTNKAKITWDGWDALIDQGISVKISSSKITWLKNDLKHRDPKRDLPAIIRSNGNTEWRMNGLRHREGDLPAVENPDGSRAWFVNGLRHREGDLPAIEEEVGKYWYVHGKLHREGDLPAVERQNGSKMWYKNGKLHRGGHLPAIISFSRYTLVWAREGVFYDRLLIPDRDLLEKISQENGVKEISSK